MAIDLFLKTARLSQRAKKQLPLCKFIKIVVLEKDSQFFLGIFNERGYYGRIEDGTGWVVDEQYINQTDKDTDGYYRYSLSTPNWDLTNFCAMEYKVVLNASDNHPIYLNFSNYTDDNQGDQ